MGLLAILNPSLLCSKTSLPVLKSARRTPLKLQSPESTSYRPAHPMESCCWAQTTQRKASERAGCSNVPSLPTARGVTSLPRFKCLGGAYSFGCLALHPVGCTDGGPVVEGPHSSPLLRLSTWAESQIHSCTRLWRSW